MTTRAPWPARRSQLALVILRVSTGLMITGLHGAHKIVDAYRYFSLGREWPLLQDTIQLGFPFPVVFASAAAIVQFVGGLLIAGGALVRPTAWLVAVTMVSATVFNLRFGGSDAQLAGLYALVSATIAMVGSPARRNGPGECREDPVDALVSRGIWLRTITRLESTRRNWPTPSRRRSGPGLRETPRSRAP